MYLSNEVKMFCLAFEMAFARKLRKALNVNSCLSFPRVTITGACPPQVVLCILLVISGPFPRGGS